MRELLICFLVCVGMFVIGLLCMSSGGPLALTLTFVGGLFAFMLLCCITVLGVQEGFGAIGREVFRQGGRAFGGKRAFGTRRVPSVRKLC